MTGRSSVGCVLYKRDSYVSRACVRISSARSFRSRAAMHPIENPPKKMDLGARSANLYKLIVQGMIDQAVNIRLRINCANS